MTNLEKLRADGSNCPYSVAHMPIPSKVFCADGCSVSCKEGMIERLSKSCKGQKWLERDVSE